MDLKPVVLSELQPPLHAVLITKPDELSCLTGFFEANKVFCLDTETNVVDRYTQRVCRTIQVGTRDQQFVIDVNEFWQRGRVFDLVMCLKPYFESREWIKVGHNLEFEYMTLKHSFGLRICGLYDTMLAEKVLFAGLQHFMSRDRWGLKDLAARYLGIEISKTEQTTFGSNEALTADQIAYAALDVRFPLAIMAKQQKRLKAENLEVCAQIEFDAIPAFGDMHMSGMLLDSEKWIAITKRNEERHAKIVAALDGHFVSAVGDKLNAEQLLEEKVEVEKYHRSEIESYKLLSASTESAWRNEKDKDQRANYRQTYTAYKKRLKDQEKQLVKDMREIDRKVKAAHRENSDYEGMARINYGSNAQLMKALLQMGIKLEDTSDTTLAEKADHKDLDVTKAFASNVSLETYGVIDLIRLYRETDKAINQYGYAWVTPVDKDGNVNPETGRIHSRFQQMGAVTGRVASQNPNMQNLPRDKAIRSCFIARPGYKLITIDASGCELRILAEMSGDPVWVEAFAQDWDVHSIGAEMIFGQEWTDGAIEGCKYVAGKKKCKCPIHDELRGKIKAINFGLAYGMSAYGLASRIGMEKEAAQALIDKYARAFPLVWAFLAKLGSIAKLTSESRTLTGRRRQWKRPEFESVRDEMYADAEKQGLAQRPTSDQVKRECAKRYGSIEREGKNSPIQGFNADMMKLAMGAEVGFLWEKLEPVYGARLCSMVHDELIIEAPDETVDAVYAEVQSAITRAAAQFMTKVKMETEGTISTCWQK